MSRMDSYSVPGEAQTMHPGPQVASARPQAQVESSQVVSLLPNSVKVSLINGAKWGYTKSGNPMVVCSKTGKVVTHGLDPSKEHEDVHQLNMFSSHQEIAKVFGEQIQQYFNFVGFIVATNVVFTCIALISWVPHASSMISKMNAEGVGPGSSVGGLAVLDLYFLASYQPSNDTNWTVMMVLATVLMFLVPLLYLSLVQFWFKDDDPLNHTGRCPPPRCTDMPSFCVAGIVLPCLIPVPCPSQTMRKTPSRRTCPPAIFPVSRTLSVPSASPSPTASSSFASGSQL